MAILLFTAGVAFGGFPLHRPAWFLGSFAVIVLLVVLGEGSYRVWREDRPHGLPTTEDVTLVDSLRLALKRGQGFQEQTDRTVIPEQAVMDLARTWHDDIYKMLIEYGARDEAGRWLADTDGLPEVSTLDVATIVIAKSAVKAMARVPKTSETGSGSRAIVRSVHLFTEVKV